MKRAEAPRRGPRIRLPFAVPIATLALALLVLLDLPSARAANAPEQAPQRLISTDAALTELIYALDAQERLVGVDTTSTHPAATAELPSVGYKRALSAEGILSLNPDLLLVTDAAGPPAIIAQIAAAGVEVRRVADKPSRAGLSEKILEIGSILEREAAARALANRLDRDFATLARALSQRTANANASADPRPGVLALVHVGVGSQLCAGRDTPINTLIELAGGRNVMHQAFTGYKPLGGESAVAAQPQFILLSQRTFEQLGGAAGMADIAGLAATPAGRSGQFIALDGSLIFSLGPRSASAARTLAQRLGTIPDHEQQSPQ